MGTYIHTLYGGWRLNLCNLCLHLCTQPLCSSSLEFSDTASSLKRISAVSPTHKPQYFAPGWYLWARCWMNHSVLLVPQLPDVGGELSFLPLFGVQLGDGVLVGGPGGGVEAGPVGGHALLEVDRASPI